MNIIKKIKSILFNEKLDMADKLTEIHNALPKIEIEEPEMGEVLGLKGFVKNVGNTVTLDGSIGGVYVDNPRLENPDDIYYCGSGPTWGSDLDGIRYWKRYNAFNESRSVRYSHLSHGDIINEKARVKTYVIEALHELGY